MPASLFQEMYLEFDVRGGRNLAGFKNIFGA